jgi:DNA-binding SARP family transcriptional activator/tetratricopeptide (TPR) repeat protein
MEFGILGPLHVVVCGRRIGVASDKQRALLALLLLRANRTVTVDRLVDGVWQERAPATAHRLVHTYVWRLRRLFHDAGERRDRIVTEPTGYRLLVEAGELDLTRFEAMLDEGHAAFASGDPRRAADLLRGAVELWRGEPLEDVPMGAGHTSELAALGERRTTAVELRMEAELALGRHAELIGELQRMRAAHPLRERPAGLLMLALYRAGRQAEALEVYRRLRQRLGDELGIDPGSEIRTLHESLLRGETATAPPTAAPAPIPIPVPVPAPARVGPAPIPAPVPPGPDGTDRLPPSVSDFTGRERELKRAHGIVSQFAADADVPGRSPAIAVVGLAGVGKTAFALHLARTVARNFPDGLLFVELQGFSGHPVAPRAALETLLRVLGVPPDEVPTDLAEQQARYRTILADRRVLVLLDDARDEAQVRPLLPPGSRCLGLVTSRQHMPGLDSVRTMVLDVLPAEDATRFLAAIVGEERVDRDPGAGRVVDLCGGLPLAVRIAGARLAARPNWSLAEFAARLEREQVRLANLTAGELAVRGALELSVRTLRPPVGLALRRLGLLGGPQIGVEAVACLADLPTGVAAAVVEELADASLLQSTARIDRYRLHDLVRLFAADLARVDDSPGERAAALRRLLSWYLHTVYAVDELLTPHRARPAVDWCEPAPPPAPPPATFPTVTDALDWCEAERPALVAAVSAASSYGLHRHGWQLAALLWGFFNQRRHWTDWLATHEVALASARQLGDLPAQAQIHNNLGNVYHDLHRLDEASYHLEQALATRREMGDQAGEASSLNNLGGVYRLMDRHDEAIACLQRSLAIRRSLGNRAAEANTLVNLGDVYHTAGRYTDSVACLEQALGIQRELGSRHGEAGALVNLADTLIDLGRYDDACAGLSQADALFEELGNQYGQAFVRHHLGRVQLALGRYEDALERLHEALAARTAMGDRSGCADTLVRIGETHLAAGQTDEARVAWRRAAEGYRQMGSRELPGLTARLAAIDRPPS